MWYINVNTCKLRNMGCLQSRAYWRLTDFFLWSWLWLVGGWTNPSEKYDRQNGNLPQVGMNVKKSLKPPTSYDHGCSNGTPKKVSGILEGLIFQENKGLSFHPSIDAYFISLGGHTSGRQVKQPWWDILYDWIIMNWLLPILLPFPVALWPKRFRLMLKSTALGTDALGCPTPWKANLAKWSANLIGWGWHSQKGIELTKCFSMTQGNHKLFSLTSKQWVNG